MEALTRPTRPTTSPIKPRDPTAADKTSRKVPSSGSVPAKPAAQAAQAPSSGTPAASRTLNAPAPQALSSRAPAGGSKPAATGETSRRGNAGSSGKRRFVLKRLAPPPVLPEDHMPRRTGALAQKNQE
ncbi:hypothetical protein VTH06DRAFT_1468 [Thermothelomyces fergusii]